jgi:hypothetical protein
MPIPAAPDSEPTTGAAAAALFRQLHQELRDALTDLDDAGLNFVPCDGANSIATIVTHLVGSEAETVRCVAGVEARRDRESEFTVGEQHLPELLLHLERAERLLEQLAPHFTPERLHAEFSLPTLPSAELRPGVTWLLGNLGHAREHVGHALLTKQLYRSNRCGT